MTSDLPEPSRLDEQPSAMTKKFSDQDKKLLDQLQDILLRQDRERLREIEAILGEEERLSEKVSPIVEKHLDFLKENFPVEFRRAVEKIVDRRIKQSQEALINIIYPRLGRMIQKYIAHQFQLLKEKIEEQLRQSWFGRLSARLRGVKESDFVVSQLDQPQIEDSYIIKKESGLLIGSASLMETVDKELIGGMLTAIKAFVEDAFQRGEEELEMIQYGTYQIMVQNYYNYYIALAVSGSLSTNQREQLSESMLKFAERELSKEFKEGDGASNLKLKRKLEKYFFKKKD